MIVICALDQAEHVRVPRRLQAAPLLHDDAEPAGLDLGDASPAGAALGASSGRASATAASLPTSETTPDVEAPTASRSEATFHQRVMAMARSTPRASDAAGPEGPPGSKRIGPRRRPSSPTSPGGIGHAEPGASPTARGQAGRGPGRDGAAGRGAAAGPGPGGSRPSRPGSPGAAPPPRRCGPRGRRARPPSDTAPGRRSTSSWIDGGELVAAFAVGRGRRRSRPPSSRPPAAAPPCSSPGRRRGRRPGAARGRASRGPRASPPCGPGPGTWPGRRPSPRGRRGGCPGRPQDHRAVALHQGGEGQLGPLVATGREPLQELTVGQAGGRPRVEERAEMAPGEPPRVACHESDPPRSAVASWE